MTFKMTFVTFCFMIFSNSILAEERMSQKLIICSEVGQVPYEMLTIKGEWFGFDVDMVKSFSEYLNLPYEMKNTAWSGIIPSLLTSHCDMIVSSMAITPEREKIISFSDTIMEDGVLAMSLFDQSKIEIKTNTILDYDKKQIRIAVPQGTYSDFAANKHIKNAQILKYETTPDSLFALMSEKVDILICDKTYVLINSLIFKDKFHVFNDDLNKYKVGAAFRKKDNLLKNKFNDFLKKWKSSGEFQKTYDKYFKSLEWRNYLNEK